MMPQGIAVDDITIAEIIGIYKSGAGITLQMLAEEYDLALSTIYKILSAEGLVEKKKRIMAEDRMGEETVESLMVDYYEEKMTIWNIAEKYGEFGITGPPALYAMLRRLGKKPRRLEEEIKQSRRDAMTHAIQLYNETDIPIYTIVAETGVDQPSLHKELHRRGVTLRRVRGPLR